MLPMLVPSYPSLKKHAPAASRIILCFRSRDRPSLRRPCLAPDPAEIDWSLARAIGCAPIISRHCQGGGNACSCDRGRGHSPAHEQHDGPAYALPPLRRSHLTMCIGQQIERVGADNQPRSEEHTSELQSLMRISYAVFCL